MSAAESESPRSILARLEQLKQWQEEQQRVLLQKQIAQRELLNQEQQKMYAILGLDRGGTEGDDQEVMVSDDEPEFEQTNMQRQLVLDRRRSPPDDSDVEVEKVPSRQRIRQPPVPTRKVPTKPFLKRGEGLKARFKVDPNSFKLDNLPKYKYANLAKSRAQDAKKRKQSEEASTADKPSGNSRGKSQEPSGRKFLARREESPPRVVLDINKVQHKKLTVQQPVEKTVSRNINQTAEECPGEESLDETDDQEEISLLPSMESLKLRRDAIESQKSAPVQPQVQPNVPWKQQLQNDPMLLRQLKELKDLNLFELLEQRLASGNASLDSDASTLLKLLAENTTDLSGLLGLSDSTIVPPPARNNPPSEEPLVQTEEVTTCLTIYPIPDPKRHFLKDDSDLSSSSSCSSTESDSDDEERGHVHFADEQEVQEIETDVESHLETVNFSRMSTPKDKSPKDRGSLSNEDDSGRSAQAEKVDEEQKRIREDILEKSELLKERLVELETEIESFRKENAELMRMKQDHELEKIKLEQDREEMMEKLNDERIKMEVYFHDERIKIDEERQKALKEAMKPTKKEKEEILRLKEQIAEMQKEAKAKEAKHASSLSRFRSQIKNLEKDLKETQLELEVIKKDNKKLETENARLKRQNNSRMLLEINKNLAKLAAPSAEPSGEPRRNSSPEKPRKCVAAKIKPIEVVEKAVIGKVATAKVISHPRRSTESRKSKLSSSDSQSESSDSSSASEADSSGDKEERSRRSSYFQGKAKKGLFQTEVQDQSQPEATAEDRSPKTAELINSLKRETVNADGSRDIWYPNGNLKKISPDGLVIRMLYFNKDIKETNMSEGTTKYYYFETNTWHTTYLDGLEILEFPDGQTEHRFKDGSTEVHFPNGSIRTTNPNSTDIAEEWKYPDGSTVIIKKNDDKVINLPNGQVEIHTKAHKRRIYPDGTIKYLYPDGSQESRYSNGRVRLKDKEGKLISDTGGTG
ncbi:centromere protein J isoform X2 [Aedes albopictus]|uniref:Centromere protein J C-terminal domain-containing protein n=1 Tax=Aedes albopictus TaxID=7160 RepID=A0ABM1ZY93_AEDAL